MSSRNNDNTAGSGFAIVAGIIAVIGIALLAALAFLCFVLTILCLIAWNKPLSIGRLTLEPQDARAFVGRGLMGMSMLPAFVSFCSLLFGLHINWSYLPYFMVGGYAIGSLGVEFLLQQQVSAATPPEPLPPPAQITQEQHRTIDAQPRETQPFQFATWDDEEKRQ